MIKPEDRIEITRKEHCVFHHCLFLLYICILAAATEVRDVLDVTYSYDLASIGIGYYFSIADYYLVFLGLLHDYERRKHYFHYLHDSCDASIYLFSETRYGEFYLEIFSALPHYFYVIYRYYYPCFCLVCKHESLL